MTDTDSTDAGSGGIDPNPQPGNGLPGIPPTDPTTGPGGRPDPQLRDRWQNCCRVIPEVENAASG